MAYLDHYRISRKFKDIKKLTHYQESSKLSKKIVHSKKEIHSVRKSVNLSVCHLISHVTLVARIELFQVKRAFELDTAKFFKQ